MSDRFGGFLLDGAAVVAGLAAGTCIAYVDSRTTWDDAGVTAAALVAAAGLFSLARPRAWLAIGFAVGVPVVAFNVLRFGRWDSAIATVFALVGAGIGGSVGRALRRSVA